MTSPLTLVLRIREESEAPIAGAELTVKAGKTEKTVRTDAEGVGRFDGFAPGDIMIRVRRVGYKQTEIPARIAAGENDLVIHVDPSSVVLDEMHVVAARPVVGRLEDFEMRRKRGETSTSITPEEIDKRNPVRLSQMLRGVPGIRITDALGSAVAISTRGKQFQLKGGLVDCPLRLMIDGVLMPELSDIDQVDPKSAYGIEVFNGPASIPLKLQSMRKEQWCGLIAIWTRSG